MKTLIFHADYIQSLMREKDVYDYRLGENCSIKDRIKQAADTLSSGTFQINIPSVRKRGDSYVSHPRTWEDKIFLRHVTQRLRLIYKIRPSHRNSVVKQISHLLKSDAAITVLRADVKSFYQSVDSEDLLRRLDRDGFLRNQELSAIALLLRSSHSYRPRGLPWGLSISSTLAELFMQEFDRKIWAIEGLFYYGRFVDDIIAVSPCISESLPMTKGLLPKPLVFGPDKTTELIEVFTPNQICSTEFEYLGYKFNRQCEIKSNGRAKNINLLVGIANKKVERILNRIDLSIAQFVDDSNFSDLKGRIQLLTGNYKIRKSGHTEKIPVGIYYNYKYINDLSSLVALDKHLQRKLIGLRSSGHFNAVDSVTIKKILSFKFTQGFERRISHRFSAEKIKRFRKVWSHE